jgi:hypothetical protein
MELGPVVCLICNLDFIQKNCQGFMITLFAAVGILRFTLFSHGALFVSFMITSGSNVLGRGDH